MYDFAVQTRPRTLVPTPRPIGRVQQCLELALACKYRLLDLVLTPIHEVWSTWRRRKVCSQLAAAAVERLVEVSLSLRTTHRDALRGLRLRTH